LHPQPPVAMQDDRFTSSLRFGYLDFDDSIQMRDLDEKDFVARVA
jgi:hypothetical protein